MREDYEDVEESLDEWLEWEPYHCDYCGTEVDEDETRCPQCGTRIKT